MRSRRVLLAVGTALLALLVVPTAGTAQSESTQQPSQAPPAPSTPAPSTPAPTTPGSTATPPSSTSAQVAGGTHEQVTVDASGGPSNLADQLKTAIAAWSEAAPGLVSLEPTAAAPSTLRYATPALLGPDTLSLDLRVPGKTGVDIEVSGDAVKAHPMVLLHEVGVLLGLPEGGQGVMAFAVPGSGEPDAPTTADVAALKAQRSYVREDLNRDGTVDFYDLVLFGQAFGSQGVNLPADFNGDGRVDNQDLALLEKAYRFAPPSQTAPSAPASGTPSTSSAPPAGEATPPAATPSTTTPSTTPQPATPSGSDTTSPPPAGGTGGNTGTP